MPRGFFLLVVGFFLLESFLLVVALRPVSFLLVALRAVPAGFALAVVECDAFAGVFLPAFGARVVIVSDLAMAAVLSGVSAAVELRFFWLVS